MKIKNYVKIFLLFMLFIILSNKNYAQLLIPHCGLILENKEDSSVSICHTISDTCILDTICPFEDISFFLDGTCWNYYDLNYIQVGHTICLQYDFHGAPTIPVSPSNPPCNTNDPVFVNYTTPGLYRVDLWVYDQTQGLYLYQIVGFVLVEGVSVYVSQSDPQICIGGCTNLTASGASTYTWMPGNLTGATVNVCPTSTTTYTVTGTSASGCTGSSTITVQIVAPPDNPIIIGNHNNCTLNTAYSISNEQPNYTYYWWLSDTQYCPDLPHYGSTINVNWVNLYTLSGNNAEFTWLYVNATNNATGCSSKDSIKIWKCCTYHVPGNYINDIIITNASQLNIYKVVNGTITINANITTKLTGLQMGPEAKIVVNPPYTYTVTSSDIFASCKYMWDGVYIIDSNAKLVVKDSLSTCSIVADALNAVVSENGGKFELKNSKFYNNYTSVLVKNNWWGPYMFPFTGYPHKGIIKGCTFAQSGTGLINPYSGQKPRYGFYLDNVDRITIGDSTVAGNTNTFRSLFCGVYSKNSTIKLVNNDFRRIKPATYCQYQYPEVFTTQYCETAVFSISATTNNLGPLCASVLTCGGNSTITRNTFDTCNMAIYTYRTTAKLTKNKIYNTNTGIKCRDVRAGSYITHSLMKTNTPVGIQVINTVPTLTRVTVMYDTILDPSNGIYLSNITSHATIALLKSVVRNNYVTLNKTGFIYGLRLENSNYINAYCNKVKRSTLVPVADSLKQIGIRVEHCANAQVHDNSCSKLSLGIKCSGNLSGATFLVNNIDSCYHGFYFETAYSGNSTVLSPQGAALSPSDNKFTEYPGKPNTYRFGGLLPAGYPGVNWWCKCTAPYIVNIPIGHPLIGKIVPQCTTGAATTLNCGTQPQGMMAGGSLLSNLSVETDTQTLNTAFSSSINFGDIDQPMKYMLKENAYRILDNMEQMPTQANLALFQQYNARYNHLKNGNTGKFDNVLRFIENGQLNEAKNINQQINPDNEVEQNLQYAYGVYFDYVLPQLTIPNTVVEQLQLIADTPPCIGGGGVYVARAILGYTETTPVDDKSLEKQVSENISEGTVIVYPNPANDEVFVLLDGYENGQKIEVELYNILGTLIINKQVISSNEAISICTAKIPAGSYILVLKTASKTLYKNRLVVIK